MNTHKTAVELAADFLALSAGRVPDQPREAIRVYLHRATDPGSKRYGTVRLLDSVERHVRAAVRH